MLFLVVYDFQLLISQEYLNRVILFSVARQPTVMLSQKVDMQQSVEVQLEDVTVFIDRNHGYAGL